MHACMPAYLQGSVDVALGKPILDQGQMLDQGLPFHQTIPEHLHILVGPI